jgi:hypothetical protein
MDLNRSPCFTRHCVFTLCQCLHVYAGGTSYLHRLSLTRWLRLKYTHTLCTFCALCSPLRSGGGSRRGVRGRGTGGAHHLVPHFTLLIWVLYILPSSLHHLVPATTGVDGSMGRWVDGSMGCVRVCSDVFGAEWACRFALFTLRFI